MIKTDLYMKVVLTIISISISIIARHNMGVIQMEEASVKGSEDKVTNNETSSKGGETLYVHVNNLDEITNILALMDSGCRYR